MALLPSFASLRTPAIYAAVAAAVLFGSYGLGYLKGRSARASTPTVTAVDSSKTADSQKKAQKTKDTTTDEDVLVTRETSPPQKMPDGSIRRQTRIKRQAVKSEKADTTVAAQSKVAERAVERKMEVQAPCPACPLCEGMINPFTGGVTEAPKLPRFLVGPFVGKDFSADRTIFGGSFAVRTGPIFWRLFVDNHWMMGGSFEVAL